LYSSHYTLWKIADFGIATQATTRRDVSTVNRRGTASYYAPEVILSGRFNNRVDTWALGCILYYELATGKQAFDISALFALMHSSSSLEIPTDLEQLKMHFSKVLSELLERDHTRRPSAFVARAIFESYRTILNQSLSKTPEDIVSIPKFPEWRELAVFYTNDDDLFDRLGEWHQSKGNFKAAVDTWNVLFRLYHGESEESIAFWSQILGKYPDSRELR
jgi:serine/threonine protein kinase